MWTRTGSTALQIVHGSRRGARDIDHLGSAHETQAAEALEAVTRQRLAGGQGELDLGVDACPLAASVLGPLQIASTQMTPLWYALGTVYNQIGFDTATEHDEVFRHSVLAAVVVARPPRAWISVRTGVPVQ